MRDTWQKIQPYVFKHEGGYVDHPRDPGGATNMGITRRTLANWRGIRPWTRLEKSEVKRLTKKEASDIYKAVYWDNIRADDLPAGIDYATYDFAVNSGPSRAVKYLQRIVGAKRDGVMGPMTLRAIKFSNYSADHIVDLLCDRRLAFMKRLKTWGTFGKGWGRRVADVREIGLQLGHDMPLKSLQTCADECGGKAEGPVKSYRDPDKMGGAATGTGGLGTIVMDAADRIEGVSEFSPTLKVVFGVLLAAGVGLLVWPRIKELWDDRRQENGLVEEGF